MSFLPPVVMEIRANASQFLSEQGKVIAAAKATATETEAAAQKEAAAARTAAAEAKRASEQQVLAAETAAKAATEAANKRILAEARATEAQTKAAQMQAQSLGVMTQEQQAAYDKQAAAAAHAASAVETATAREAQAQDKAAAAATASAAAQVKASDLQAVAAEKSAAAQEVAATRSKAAMTSVVGIANKVTAVTLLAGAGIAVGATEMAAKFEKSTMLLVTAGGESMSALDSVRKGILEISTSTGTTAEQMSEGMYIMEKAGYRGAAGLAALKASAQGAKDENVDLATMAQATTDVLLDYGYKMDTAANATDSSVRVTNMLVAASGAAKTTMTDFAGSMAAVVPIASTAKISFDQVGGAIATMTQHGQTAQQSSQNLANLIQSLVRPNAMASAAMSQLGIDTTDLAKNLGERGLSGSLKIVDDAIKAHTQDGMVFTGTMKDNANATKAMDTIVGQMSPTMAKLSTGLKDGSVSIKDYSKATKDMGGEAGALGLQFMSLYKANSGVTDSLKAGKPAYETYAAALRDTLGNVTAMRAAQMLLMNNGKEFEANIKAIGDAGKKTGQDISTWADMQSTLSVKMDQTKAMVSNLGIEMGTKLLPAAKDLVGGFTDLFHGFEQGNPVLTGLADLLGIVVAGSVVNFGIKMGKMVVSTISGFVDMGAAAIAQSTLFVKGMMADEMAIGQFSTKAEIAGARVKGALAVAGTAAGMLGVALVLGSIGTDKAVVSTDTLTRALVDFSDAASKAGKTELDGQFSNWDKVFGGTVDGVNSVDTAFHKLLNNGNILQGIGHWFDPLNKAIGQAQTPLGEIDDRIGKVGDQLGKLATGGSIDVAAKSFDGLALTWKKQGGSVQDFLDKMPAYKQSLIDSAAASGVQLGAQELTEYAMGKVPQKMLDAMSATQKYTDATGQVKPITPALQKSLDDAGVSAEGLAKDLSKVLDGMLATGMATETSRSATANFNKTLRDADTAVADLIKSNVDVSNALNATGTDFNLASDAGATLNEKFTAVKDKGLAVAKSLVGQGKDSVVGALQDTYDNMLKAADAEGIHGQAAIDLTRNLLGIPKNVDVKAWMDSAAAQAAADNLGTTVSNLDGKTIHLYAQANIQDAWNNISALQAHAQDASSAILNVNSMQQANQYANGNAYQKPPGGFTGGSVASIMGFAGGGIVPGTPPTAPNVDNILAMVDGKPLKVRSGEFINNEPSTKANLPWLKASNAGLNIGNAMQSRFAAGIAVGQSRPTMAGPSHPGQNITINAQTNATSQHIAAEVAWALRTQ